MYLTPSHRQLCVMLSAEDIYRTLAELLQEEEDLIFASKMVQTLSSILLTSKELFSLRIQLKDLSTVVSPLLACCTGVVLQCSSSGSWHCLLQVMNLQFFFSCAGEL